MYKIYVGRCFHKKKKKNEKCHAIYNNLVTEIGECGSKKIFSPLNSKEISA